MILRWSRTLANPMFYGVCMLLTAFKINRLPRAGLRRLFIRCLSEVELNIKVDVCMAVAARFLQQGNVPWCHRVPSSEN